MTPQSRKSKGRRLQQHVANRIKDTFFLSDKDVKSLPMGSQGADVWLSTFAFQHFPFSIECKAQEKISIWEAYEQASNHGPHPLVVFTRNRSEPLCVLSFEDLLHILKTRDLTNTLSEQGSPELIT